MMPLVVGGAQVCTGLATRVAEGYEMRACPLPNLRGRTLETWTVPVR